MENKIDPIIQVRDLYKTFSENGKELVALDRVNLDIPRNQFTVLIGPSGCGKTTLLNTIAGFEKATSGQILLDGQPILKPAPDRGYVFQDYALFPLADCVGKHHLRPDAQRLAEAGGRGKGARNTSIWCTCRDSKKLTRTRFPAA